MKTVEVSGRTLDEAIEAAASELEVSKEQVSYEVIEEGNKGFLGLGQTPSLIKAWVNEESVESVPVATEEEKPEAPAEEGHELFAKTAMDVLTDILEAMSIKATPILKPVDSNYVQIDIVGADVAILIGKHGQTLDALQYLLQIAASKKLDVDTRLVLDAEGYRERHRKMLEKKALEYAEAVKVHQKEAVLDPQPARDRRIIHMSLADHPDVYTYSEGEGDERHVVISPKR